MDFALLLWTLVVMGAAFALGRWEHGRLVRIWPETSLEQWHRKAGAARFLMLALALLTLGSFILVARRNGNRAPRGV